MRSCCALDLSIALHTVRFTISWKKKGDFSSAMQRTASPTSLDSRYSCSSWSTATFTPSTGRPSPGPHECSSLAPPWSRESISLASSTTSPPRLRTTPSARKLGGSTSSATARARKVPSNCLAAGTSFSTSSMISKSLSKPLPTMLLESKSGYSAESSCETCSRSRSPLSHDLFTRRFTNSYAYSGAPISCSALAVSLTSPLTKNSTMMGSTALLYIVRVIADSPMFSRKRPDDLGINLFSESSSLSKLQSPVSSAHPSTSVDPSLSEPPGSPSFLPLLGPPLRMMLRLALPASPTAVSGTLVFFT
mmetsp:Transcript_33904/g.74666  ORF Transcript_33904/g.74666 Transcript_33904/m.74666 type:complete len:306 (+) Transcript_33904:427-1344(+)